MTEVTIEHTPEGGTLCPTDIRPNHEILSKRGWRFSRNIGSDGAWFIPRSRDKAPQTAKIEATAEALRAAGYTVTVTIDDGRRTTAEVEADRADRAEVRADRLADRADRLNAEATRRFEKADSITGQIPFGQPILVGHHSEHRHRNAIRKAQANMAKGVETYREAKETDRRAEAAAATQRQRESVPTTRRRIDKLEADRRAIERRITGKPCPFVGARVKATAERPAPCPCGTLDAPVAPGERIPVHYTRTWDAPASGDHLARLEGELKAIDEQVGYWQDRLADAADQGVKVWGPADFTKGDLCEYWHRGSWGTVVRVSAKSVTVTTGYTWTQRVTWDQVVGRRPKPTPEGAPMA